MGFAVQPLLLYIVFVKVTYSGYGASLCSAAYTHSSCIAILNLPFSIYPKTFHYPSGKMSLYLLTKICSNPK